MFPPEGQDERPEVLELFRNLKENRAALESLLGSVLDHWVYEDGVYRFYHQSLKVWNLQFQIEKIVRALKALHPKRPLNKWFLQIVEDGTQERFKMAFNRRWLEHARPVVEAFFHAKYFLEMAVKYAKELEAPPNSLPSGWAGFLYLYNLR